MADNKRAASFVVKLKQAVMIDGEMAVAGEEVELSRSEARNLLHRKIAEIVEAEPEKKGKPAASAGKGGQ